MVSRLDRSRKQWQTYESGSRIPAKRELIGSPASIQDLLMKEKEGWEAFND
jgi:hypothetical protein